MVSRYVPTQSGRTNANNGGEFLIWRIFKTRLWRDGWRNEFDVVVGQATNNGGQVQQRRTIFQAAEYPPEAEDVHLRRTEVCGDSSLFAKPSSLCLE